MMGDVFRQLMGPSTRLVASHATDGNYDSTKGSHDRNALLVERHGELVLSLVDIAGYLGNKFDYLFFNAI
jgi:hypothetical protein